MQVLPPEVALRGPFWQTWQQKPSLRRLLLNCREKNPLHVYDAEVWQKKRLQGCRRVAVPWSAGRGVGKTRSQVQLEPGSGRN